MERRKNFAEKYGIVKVDYATVDTGFAGRVIWTLRQYLGTPQMKDYEEWYGYAIGSTK